MDGRHREGEMGNEAEASDREPGPRAARSGSPADA